MEANVAAASEFPSVLESDTREPSPYQAALLYLRRGLQALNDLPRSADPAQRAARDELLAIQKQSLQLLHINFASDGDSHDTKDFSQLLKQRREAAGLTQEQLGDFCGLSLSLVRKLEQGSKTPTRNTLLRLCSLPDLKLVPEEITTMPEGREHGERLAPNWYVSPGFDSMQMMSDLAQQLNGGGGTIEQTHMYLDHQSAMDWVHLCNGASYASGFREHLPLGAMARRVREVVGQIGLDVIALGPGDGRTEVRLVQNLLEASERPSIRFYLFDASQPLLSRAFRYAVDTLDDQPGVFVCGIQGNFHHLPRYMQLHYSPARSHRRRLYTLLGFTMGNIDNEPQFFRNSMVGAAPGDLLLVDMTIAYGRPENPAEIRQKDPTLNNPLPAANERFLSGPIRRYCQELQSVHLSWELDTNRPISGSYGLDAIADVTLAGQRHKRFCMYHVRRHTPVSYTHLTLPTSDLV